MWKVTKMTENKEKNLTELTQMMLEGDSETALDGFYKPEPPVVPKTRTFTEKMVLPAALLIAVLFDRLIVAGVLDNMFTTGPGLYSGLGNAYSVFWLVYMVVLYALYWKRLKHDKVLWFVAVASVAIAVWAFVFPTGNWQYRYISMLVLPCVLMAHAQWLAGRYTLKNSSGIVIAWIYGWLAKPFTGLLEWFFALGSLMSENNKPRAKKAMIGIIVAFALLIIIIPLLMSADRVFNYYIMSIFAGGNISSVIGHTIVITIAFGLFFSFIWNIGFGKNETHTIDIDFSIDTIISAIVLGSIIAVYLLFCFVLFNYLFAGAGLPDGMTYAEYAREGFAQTVAVCAVNLLLFGVFLRYGAEGKFLRALLGGLLLMTAVMLVSGAVRLHLYIYSFGMTWLRLLSTWHLIYLAVVTVLCVIRLFFLKKMPIVAYAALFLLIWFVVLGYINPDGFVIWFNYGFRGADLIGF